MAVEKEETGRRPAAVAIEVETDRNPAVVDDRSLAEHNHHEAGVLLVPAGEAEFMHRPWPHRVNNLPSALDSSRRSIARRRSVVRTLADNPQSPLVRP